MRSKADRQSAGRARFLQSPAARSSVTLLRRATRIASTVMGFRGSEVMKVAPLALALGHHRDCRIGHVVAAPVRIGVEADARTGFDFVEPIDNFYCHPGRAGGSPLAG